VPARAADPDERSERNRDTKRLRPHEEPVDKLRLGTSAGDAVTHDIIARPHRRLALVVSHGEAKTSRIGSAPDSPPPGNSPSVDHGAGLDW